MCLYKHVFYIDSLSLKHLNFFKKDKNLIFFLFQIIKYENQSTH